MRWPTHQCAHAAAAVTKRRLRLQLEPGVQGTQGSSERPRVTVAASVPRFQVSSPLSCLRKHAAHTATPRKCSRVTKLGRSAVPSSSVCCRGGDLLLIRCLHTATTDRAPAAAGSSRKPRIVLIGWLGAQERHFHKYVALWEGWGHQTLSIRPPTLSIALPLLGDRAAAHFARRLHDANAAASPKQRTVIHIFRWARRCNH